jgi:hypothetical protein
MAALVSSEECDSSGARGQPPFGFSIGNDKLKSCQQDDGDADKGLIYEFTFQYELGLLRWRWRWR